MRLLPALLFLAALLAPAALAENPQPPAGPNWTLDKERPGRDIGRAYTSAGPEECESYCNDNFNCKAWTMLEAYYQGHVTDQVCYLKGEVLPEIDNPDAVSGVKKTAAAGPAPGEPPSPLRFEEGICRDRHQYEQVKVADARACQARCDGQAKCQAWAFVEMQEKNCFLFDYKPPRREDRWCVSGEK